MNKMRPRKIITALLTLIAVGVTGGCHGKNKIPDSVTFYTLDYAIPEFENSAISPVALCVEKFKTSPPYDSTRIIYSTDAFTLSRYYYHQWIAPPGEMTTRLLTRDLSASQLFQAVVNTRTGYSTHYLAGTIDEFFEQDREEGWNAVISITATLTADNRKDGEISVCFQKTYRRRMPCTQKNPKSLARAMSLALAEISTELAADIRAAIE